MVKAAAPVAGDLWKVLEGVLDPEVPVLSVVDLGIVRDVRVTDDGVEVVVTPTYSGCPAVKVIERDIVGALRRAGVAKVRVRTEFAPAWTTDWMSDAAREKLRAYGIAPPRPRVGDADADPLVQLLRRQPPPAVPCPWCGAAETELRSAFGPTACKSIRYCPGCRQPFEAFKAL
ncbi:MAG: phenylacetate-CoA oxygenase subunit PaaJ [Gemmatimonadetes bacterium]|nr:phenylacetate-CoA oxygenase subunit PaaJ [Gemmatimonadota bacterium]